MTYVEITVKEQFRAASGPGIDPEKSFSSETPLMDRYVFKIYNHRPLNNHSTEHIVHANACDIYEATAVLRDLMRAHLARAMRFDERYATAEGQPRFYVPLGDHATGVYAAPCAHKTEEECSAAQCHDMVIRRVHAEPLDLDQYPADEKWADEEDEAAILRQYQLLRGGDDPPRVNLIVTEAGEEKVPPEPEEVVKLSVRERVRAFCHHAWHTKCGWTDVHTSWVKFQTRMVGRFCVDLGRFLVVLLLWGLMYTVSTPRRESHPLLPEFLKFGVGMWTLWKWTWFRGLPLVWLLLRFEFLSTPRGTVATMRDAVVPGVAVVSARRRLRAYFDWGKENLPKCHPYLVRWQKEIGTISLSLLALAAAAQLYRSTRRRRIRSESTRFVFGAKDDAFLNEVEESMAAGESITRYPVKGQQTWNVRLPFVSTPPAFTGKRDEFVSRVSQMVHVLKVRTRDGKRQITTHCLGLCQNVVLVNTHALMTGNVEVMVAVGGTEGHSWTRIEKKNRVDLGSDRTLLALEGFRCRDALMHFAVESLPDRREAVLGTHPTRAQIEYGYVVCNDAILDDFHVEDMWVYDYPDHRSGDCGLPLIVESGSGWVVAGIHTGGCREKGAATQVLKGLLEQGVKDLLKQVPLIQICSESQSFFPLEEPAAKSVVHYVPLRSMRYAGKLKGPVLVKGKSKLQKTRIADEAEQLFHDQGWVPSMFFGKPLMEPREVNGEYQNPYNLALSKMSNERGALSLSVMERVVDKYTARIISGLRERNHPALAPLDINTAVNGALEDIFLRRVNCSTSAGFGLLGVKADFLPVVKEEPFTRQPTGELRALLREIFESYLRGEGTHTVYRAQLKDEVREITKCQEQTRGCSTCPLWRLSWYSVLCSHHSTPLSCSTVLSSGRLSASTCTLLRMSYSLSWLLSVTSWRGTIPSSTRACPFWSAGLPTQWFRGS